MVLHWDVIPDPSAVSPSCAQARRNVYVEICETRHRVVPGSQHMNCLCTHVAKQVECMEAVHVRPTL